MIKISKKKILLVILAIAVILPILNIQINKMKYANKVSDYLIEEKGYKQEEVKSVEGVWGKKMPAYYVIVVFENEPNVEYTYFAHGKVKQISFQSVNSTTVTVDDLKNYEPSSEY